MSTTQLALFDIAGMMQKNTVSVEDYYREFQSLGHHQRSNAGYSGDSRAEKEVRDLIRQGDTFYKQWKQGTMTDNGARTLCTNFSLAYGA